MLTQVETWAGVWGVPVVPQVKSPLVCCLHQLRVDCQAWQLSSNPSDSLSNNGMPQVTALSQSNPDLDPTETTATDRQHHHHWVT